MKEKKQLQADDKNHRKIFKLEQEISSLNEINNLIRTYAVPMMMSLLKREFNREDHLSNEIVKQIIQDVEYEFRKMQKEIQDNSQTIKSNLRKIDSLQNALDQNENKHPNNYRGGYSPTGARRSGSNDEQLKSMQQEKN